MQSALKSGDVVGRGYVLVRRAHSDAFGEIWSARHEQRALSIRVLDPAIGIAPGASTALLAIVRRGFRHPHVATLVDVLCENGRWLLVSEAAGGETLASLVTARGPLSPDAAFKLAKRVGDGLRAIHDAGGCHGRLDPTRVIVRGDEVTIVDVGLGMLLGDESEEWRSTVPDASDPTVAFLSPEQAAGDGAPTAESDVYALGAVLYFATHAEAPHSARTRAELSVASARRIVHVARAGDRALAALIAPCLSREPAMRPDLHELLAEIHRESMVPYADTSTPGASLSLADIPREVVRRTPTWIVMSSIFALSLILGLIFRAPTPQPERAPAAGGLPALASPPPASSRDGGVDAH
jgi:eukaryotic-like serine/threonine-protein kinase